MVHPVGLWARGHGGIVGRLESGWKEKAIGAPFDNDYAALSNRFRTRLARRARRSRHSNRVV
jgi:hypothetical protein